MPLVSSLDQTPWRSGSPHGVRGIAYGVGGPALYAVITSGGADGDALCPATGRLAMRAMTAATTNDESIRVNMS
jgi:hypothetical protein